MDTRTILIAVLVTIAALVLVLALGMMGMMGAMMGPTVGGDWMLRWILALFGVLVLLALVLLGRRGRREPRR